MRKNIIEGNIVDVVNRKIFSGRITMANGKIVSIKELDTISSNYIIPGFIDAHVHVESSMLIPSEFARLAVCHGTVGTISDPHEIGNVLGKSGVEFMIENGRTTPFKFHFGAPSCVPATVYETAGAEINLNDIEDILQMPRVNYLAEVMNFPGVLNRDPEVMAKIELAIRMGKQVDGHAPGLRGEDAKNYIEAGISTDHECFTKIEALDKLKFGMNIIIREGSAAKNFEELWSLIDEYPEYVMFCSDDKHPNDLAVGHINRLAKRAIEKGCDLFNVLRAASYNPIKHYNMDIGMLQINDPADFCVVKDLSSFEVLKTYIDGELVASEGKTMIASSDSQVINNFSCSEIAVSQLRAEAKSNVIRAIVVEDGQLVTNEVSTSLDSKDGYLLSDIEQDILKIVVVNRYIDTSPAIGFVKNFGLRHGAIASCVAHDSHNIIAVGTNDEDLCEAVNLIIRSKGGVSLSNGNEKELVELPVAGIMSDKDGYLVADAYESIDLRAKELGTSLSAPYMTLSFCALLVIPKLKLSDKGLFDGDQFCFKDLYLNVPV
ncbi:MAG: adenine deaminase [Crocinitomicaceae bacterium]|nr:adenine deaminase [Crocinitomicaceae bacterium]